MLRVDLDGRGRLAGAKVSAVEHVRQPPRAGRVRGPGSRWVPGLCRNLGDELAKLCQGRRRIDARGWPPEDPPLGALWLLLWIWLELGLFQIGLLLELFRLFEEIIIGPTTRAGRMLAGFGKPLSFLLGFGFSFWFKVRVNITFRSIRSYTGALRSQTGTLR